MAPSMGCILPTGPSPIPMPSSLLIPKKGFRQMACITCAGSRGALRWLLLKLSKKPD